MCKKTMLLKLPQMFLGILFVFAGIMKLFVMSPGMFAGMIEANFGMIGLVGGLAVFTAWFIAIVELLGGLALIMCKVPVMIKKILISILIAIMVGAIVFVHVRGGDIMSALKDLVLLSILVSVCKTLPCSKKMCTKKVCDKKNCDDEKCVDGTCAE